MPTGVLPHASALEAEIVVNLEKLLSFTLDISMIPKPVYLVVIIQPYKQSVSRRELRKMSFTKVAGIPSNGSDRREQVDEFNAQGSRALDL